MISDNLHASPGWSDIVSLFLFLLCVLVGGLRPSIPIPIYGLSSARALVLTVTFSATIFWTVFRLIDESMQREFGPREFMLAGVVYLMRWLYLWLRVRVVPCREHRMYRVARALRNVHMLRFGRSSESTRRGAPEVVIRRGVKVVGNGGKYWRGVKTAEIFHDDVGIWEVFLEQRELHNEDLDVLASSRYVECDHGVTAAIYKKFYGVVMKAVNYRGATDQEFKNAEKWDPYTGMEAPREGYEEAVPVENGQIRRVEVDFSPFTQVWYGLPVEGLAKESGADDARMIGRVARRIAADACAFINDEEGEVEFRTERQVELLNECLRKAGGSVFVGGLREGR